MAQQPRSPNDHPILVTLFSLAALAGVFACVLTSLNFFGAPTYDALQTRVSILLATPTSIVPTVAPTPASPSSSSSAKFQKIWAEQNKVRDGKSGMNIMLNFTAHELQFVPCRAVVYFYFADGRQFINPFATTLTEGNQVAIGKNFTPTYIDSVFENFTIFLPYEELNLHPDTRFDIFVNAALFTQEPTIQLDTSGNYPFCLQC